jgi:hypothetical protein
VNNQIIIINQSILHRVTKWPLLRPVQAVIGGQKAFVGWPRFVALREVLPPSPYQSALVSRHFFPIEISARSPAHAAQLGGHLAEQAPDRAGADADRREQWNDRLGRVLHQYRCAHANQRA